jgi:hypothetical protein
MALNMNDKKNLALQILPEVDFNITTTGVTVHASQRLSMPRVIPFDNQGKCKECKSSEVELDFVVTKEGVTLFCTRMKGSRFVPFDSVHDLPGHCFFKIKNKGRVFNVEHGQQAPVICHPINSISQKEIQAEPPQKMPKLEPEKEYNLKETLSEIYAYLDWIVPSGDVAEGMIGRVKKAGGMGFEAFLDALSAATSFTTNPNGNNISPELLETYQKNSAKHNKIFAPKNPESRTIPFSVLLEILAAAATFLGDSELPSKPNQEPKEEEVKSDTVQAPVSDQYEAFYESMKAATTGIPDQPKRVKELKEQAKQMKEEEEAAIASITPSIPNIPIENKPISPSNVKFF